MMHSWLIRYLAAFGLVMYFDDGGGGGGSSTSSTTSSSTTSTDKRQVVSDNGVGVSSDSSTIYLTQTDSGAVAGAIDLAKTTGANALTAYEKLLGVSGVLVDKLFQSNEKNQALAQAALESYTPADSGGVEKAKIDGYVKVAGIVAAGYVIAKAVFK